MAGGGIVIVALHPGAFAGNGGNAQRYAGALIGLAKSGARHQGNFPLRGGSAGPSRLAHARHRQRSAFNRQRKGFEFFGLRQIGGNQIKLRQVSCKEFGSGKSGKRIRRRGPRHGNGRFSQAVE